MCKRGYIALLGAIFIWFGVAVPVSAGKFVTEKERAWAKKAIREEKSVDGSGKGRTLAILYFKNDTGLEKLNLLEKGLTLMLITDLSNLPKVQLLERVKMQALFEEMGLGVTGIVTRETAPRVGRLLGATLLVGGNIGKDKRLFQFNSDVLNVPTEKSLGSPSVDGDLLEGIFAMEKELVFEIIRILKLELSPKKLAEIREPITDSIEALMYWFKAIEEGDKGNYNKAKDFFDKTAEADPGFPDDLLAYHPEVNRDPGVTYQKGVGGGGGSSGGSSIGGGGGSGGGKACAAQRNKLLRNTLRRRRF